MSESPATPAARLRLLLYTAPDPAADLALEEAIHTAVEEGLSPATWRLWQAREPAVILGTGQEAAREANLPEAEARGIRVLRRHSGGGCVLIGPGALNFSAFYPYTQLPGSETIRGAMLAALQPVFRLLERHGLSARDAGHSDVVVAHGDGTIRKLAGNAQARKRTSVLVHGTLLADPDWELLETVLNFPSSVPEYRANRGHRAFLTSLRERGVPHALEAFAESLLTVLGSGVECTQAPSAEELSRAERLRDEKYATREWNFRR